MQVPVVNDHTDELRMPPTLQMTDDAVIAAQRRSKWVQRAVQDGKYRGVAVQLRHGLVTVETPRGRREMLPPEL